MTNIGIIGLGFVGNSMYESFKLKGIEVNNNLFGYDKYKNGGIGVGYLYNSKSYKQQGYF